MWHTDAHKPIYLYQCSTYGTRPRAQPATRPSPSPCANNKRWSAAAHTEPGALAQIRQITSVLRRRGGVRPAAIMQLTTHCTQMNKDAGGAG